MNRSQMNQQAKDIHQQAARRTEQHFNSMRPYWEHVEIVNPAAYKAAQVRVFQIHRREIIIGL